MHIRVVTKYTLCLSIFLNGIPSALHAEDYKVDAPRIGEVGGISPEIDFTYTADPNKDKNAYFGQVYGINYGVNSFWETSFFAEIEKQPGETTKFSNVKWENTFVPFKPGEYWIDVGFFVGISKAIDNELTNNLETKLLLEKDVGNFANKANIILDRNFGPHSVRGENAGFAWMTTYKIDEHFQPGIEYYTDLSRIDHVPEFNKQSHVIGPVMQGEFHDLTYDTGVLFGLSDGAPNVIFKLDFGYDF